MHGKALKSGIWYNAGQRKIVSIFIQLRGGVPKLNMTQNYHLKICYKKLSDIENIRTHINTDSYKAKSENFLTFKIFLLLGACTNYVDKWGGDCLNCLL